MGQQQLLLLVLSTVIVGLATVAGIQAFSENQEQATQDALVQRGLTIASDIKAAVNKPAQLGGPSSFNAASVADAAGFDEADDSGNGIPAEGAGSGATCDIKNVSGNNPDDFSADIVCSTGGGDQSVTVTLGSDGEITTSV